MWSSILLDDWLKCIGGQSPVFFKSWFHLTSEGGYGDTASSYIMPPCKQRYWENFHYNYYQIILTQYIMDTSSQDVYVIDTLIIIPSLHINYYPLHTLVLLPSFVSIVISYNHVEA